MPSTEPNSDGDRAQLTGGSPACSSGGEPEPPAGLGLHVCLVGPEIHGNTGNIGRTCLATGAQLHLVEPLGFSLEDAKVKRAGLDYWPRVRPRLWPDWDSFAANLPELGAPFLFSAEATRDLWSARFPARSVLVFGCESVGLPVALRRRYREDLVRIPIAAGSVRSLNLANAVAVGLYEVIRQQRERKR